MPLASDKQGRVASDIWGGNETRTLRKHPYRWTVILCASLVRPDAFAAYLIAVKWQAYLALQNIAKAPE